MLSRAIALAISLLLIPSVAKADECVTIDMLAKSLASDGVALFGSLPAASRKIVATINENRIANNKPAIEGSILVVGFMKDAQDNTRVGVAVFDKNHCVISETIANLSLDQWNGFLGQAKVDPKEFAKVEGI